jgi:hypothetical protein
MITITNAIRAPRLTDSATSPMMTPAIVPDVRDEVENPRDHRQGKRVRQAEDHRRDAVTS